MSSRILDEFRRLLYNREADPLMPGNMGRVTTFLRPWHPDDADSLRQAVASSPDLARQFGERTPASADECAVVVAGLSISDRAENWAIVADGRLVGNVGVGSIDHRHDTGWMHYWLTADARGRGLATRALASLAARAFDDLRLFRMELGHRVNNPASCAVAVRAGFVAEGIERQKLRYGDERFDTETHARLATDPAPEIELLRFEAPRR